MQFSLMKSTIPLAYCTIAPGAGHAFRQPGSSQCMQPSLRINHSRLPFSSSHSVNRIKVQVLGSKSSGLSYVPSKWPTSCRRLFHSMQAAWQALQPMQRLTSISFATSAS
jgi:hypothetical protein